MQSATNSMADFMHFSEYGLINTPQAEEKSSGMLCGLEVVKITVVLLFSPTI